jgi:hypothetical protein
VPAQKTKTSTGARAPVNPIGAVLNGAFSMSGMAPWSSFVDDVEYVPELRWPLSVRVYEKMRSDSQLAALYNATILALMKFQWQIDPNGADEKMVKKLSKDYNLPIAGEKVNQRLRSKRRFAFRSHLRKACYAGIYGHYYFEQVGYIGDDRNAPNDGLWHLRKLESRPPRTIQDFRLAEDGGLISIIQNVSKPNSRLSSLQLPEIPIDVLVAYVWDQEDGNWVGRSWFRECYANWLIKDRLMRIDAINHERAGGVPYVEAHPGATFPEIERLNEMAKGFRIGDTSGGAVPAGAKFQIARGTNSSVVDSIRYHDEAMARKFMLMVMQLGQTKTGSRALGTTFVDFWGGGLEAIASWFADTFNEYVIEDDIDWNFGEEVEQVPILTFEYDPALVVTDLVALVTSGVIQVDDDLENEIRKEMGLTDKGTPRENTAVAPPAPNPASDPAVKQPAAKPKKKTQAGAEDDALDAPSRRNRPLLPIFNKRRKNGEEAAG